MKCKVRWYKRFFTSYMKNIYYEHYCIFAHFCFVDTSNKHREREPAKKSHNNSDSREVFFFGRGGLCCGSC